MKANTPTVIQQGKHSLNNDLLDIERDEDIEKEIEKRRDEAINKSSEVRRKSTATALIAGLTGSELLQHCKECIKLSTENKINTKNAFSFLLIDAMAAMAKKADSEINKNFQVASCTLDASVKIYGYRVDAVHTEAIKMAGGVLSKEVQNDEDKNENLVDNETRTKLKKKKRKKLTVAHPETLNAKSETELIMDFVPHQSFLMHKSERNDLLIKIPKFDDSSILYINSEYNYWPENVSSTVDSFKRNENFDIGSIKSMMSEIELSKEHNFCSYYHNFEFGKNDGDSLDNSDNEEFNSSDINNRFEFDLNAPVEDIPMEDECEIIEMQTKRKKIEVPLGGYDSDQEIKLPSTPEKNNFRNMQISDLKDRITAMPLEYSIFDEQVLKAWAGPSFWKVFPRKKKQEEKDKEDENVSKAIGSKRTRKGKIKPTTGLFDMKDTILEKHLACGEKTTLSKSTMLNWSPQNVTVPKDCKYNPKSILSLFHLPNFLKIGKKDVGTNQIEFIDISDSRSEQNEELEYCSNFSLRLEEVAQEEEEKREENLPFDEKEMWNEQNMVSLPNRVEKILVSTYKRKKCVDIKQLKKCLWNMITEPEAVPETSRSEAQRSNPPITFSKIMNTYPNYVPSNIVPHLSAAQIFNALLHLANEKNLVLTQDYDNGDFNVSL